MNKILIEKYYKLNFKKSTKNKLNLKNSMTCEDIFQNKILELLELKYIIDDTFIIRYFKLTRNEKRNMKTLNYIPDIEDKTIIEETYDDKINLLFIDYRPEK